MEESEELIRAVESASNGFWLPMATIVAVFSVIVLLLLYIWKQSQKANDKRHSDSEEIIKQLSKTTVKISNVLTRLEANQENQQKDIDKILN